MSLKKNTVSYVTWIILLLFTGAACSFFGMIIANIVKMDVILVTAGIIIGFFAFIFLLYILTGILAGKLKRKELSVREQHMTKVLEPLLLVFLLAAGLIVRFLFFSMAGEDADYFELAKVTGNSTQSIQSVQGSVYYYCILLHGLFRVVGNSWNAGIWLQIGLQLFGILICYFAVKRMVSKVPAFLVVAFMLFAPCNIKAGLTYSPQMLYFCIFAIVLWVVADYLHRSCDKEHYTMSMWVYTIIVASLIGVCCYIDISGIILGLPLICILLTGNPYRSVLSKAINLGLLVFSGRSAFGICIWIDAIICDNVVFRVMDAWKLTYSFSGFALERLVAMVQAEFVALVVIACIGCVSFWRRKNVEYFTPCILMVMGMCVLIAGGYTIDNMDGSYLLYVLLAVQAAVSVTELFYVEKSAVVITDKLQEETVADTVAEKVKFEPVATSEKPTEVKPAEKIPMENHTEEKVELFENPLPVPKKHVKKNLDYSFTPEPAAMKYDVQVSDRDDYDYK